MNRNEGSPALDIPLFERESRILARFTSMSTFDLCLCAFLQRKKYDWLQLLQTLFHNALDTVHAFRLLR